MFDADAIAAELYAAARTATPVPLLTERFPEMGWDDARRIARATDARRRAVGEELIGYKLGWTSAAMREALGIDRPNWGTLWRSQLVSDVIHVGAFIHPKVEPELIFWPTDTSPDGEWALGLEIVDPRFPSFSFDALDNTADNSSSAAVVEGDFYEVDAPEDIEITFSNGVEERVGRGSNAMGSPAAAVDWLRQQLATEGSYIRPDDMVFTGGLTAPFDLVAGTTYTLSAPGFNPVVLVAT